MPSVEKAIINPFEPLSVGEALLVAASGLLVVFVMLAMLMAVIWVISRSWLLSRGRSPPRLPRRRRPPPPLRLPPRRPLRWMRASWWP